MATNEIYAGSEGVVKVDGDAVASIRSFSLEETQETIDATTMNVSGVPFRTNKATFKSWSGTVDVFWTVDTTQTEDVEQGATYSATEPNDAFGHLQPGATPVMIEFWPSGNTTGSGALGYKANAIVTSRTISSSVDGMVEATISVLGTEAITAANA
jgi:hypothetical protein